MGLSKRTGLTEPESLYVTDPVLGSVLDGRYQTVIDTPGTGRAMPILTAFSTTNGVIAMEAVGTYGRIVRPHYLRMICTVSGASATSMELVIAVDTIARYSAGGTALVNNVAQPNTGYGKASEGVEFGLSRFTVGTLTIGAEGSSVRRYVRATVRTGVLVVGDEIYIDFTSAGSPAGPRSGTAANSFYIPVGPVVLAPPAGATHSLVVHVWNPGNAVTAPSFEFSGAWFELKNPHLL